MQFTIDGGAIQAWSRDEQVTLFINPRRSPQGDPTRVSLRCAPRPMMELEPERSAGAPPAQQWVWSGTPNDATRICDMILAQLPQLLHPDEKSSARSNSWREQVLRSLRLVPPAAMQDGQLAEIA